MLKQESIDHPAEIYARQAAAGEIVCSKWVRLAAKRHLDDLEHASERGFRFSPEKAQRAIKFFDFLRHSKGEWAGKKFVLAPWQQFILWVVFGWVIAETGYRRFRRVYVEVAKKNGKSTLCAGVALYLLLGDNEPGAEVYCAASDKYQAQIVFSECQAMVDSSPALAKKIAQVQNNLSILGSHSKLEPLSKDNARRQGKNVHGAIYDEYHEAESGEITDALYSSSGARRQPMHFYISNSGIDRNTVCFELRSLCEKVLEGTIENDRLFAFIAGIDKKDPWDDESNWVKANPNLGISPKLEDLRALADEAKQDPRALNSFLRFQLSVWTQQLSRVIPMEKWRACTTYQLRSLDPAKFRTQIEAGLKGRRCFGALDLASKQDLTAESLLFTPEDDAERWKILMRFWLPEETLAQRIKEQRFPYDVWAREGWITATPGNVIDYKFIHAQVLKDAQTFEFAEVAFDPFNATQTAVELGQEGIAMVEFRQGFASISEATKQFIALVVSEKLEHFGNPVLTFNADNLAVEEDSLGNVRPSKKKSSEKIDGVVAGIMSLGRAIATPPEPKSVYEDRGIIFFDEA